MYSYIFVREKTMNNPETIIRGIMKEAAAKESAKIAQLVGRHIGSKPTAAKANKHFTHDKEAAEQIVKLAQSMEEQIELDEGKPGGTRNLFGINHTDTDAHKDIIKLAGTLGYKVLGRSGKNNTFKVYHGDRLITQISTDGGPAGNRRPLVDMHRHQMEVDGFRGDEHTIDSIRRSQRGLDEQIQQLDEIGDTPAGQAALKSYIRRRSRQIADKSETLGFNRGIDVTNNQLTDSERIGAAGNRVKAYDQITGNQIGVDRALDRLREEKSAAWQRSEGKDPEGGLNKKGVESYRRENPGSKLQTAVTTEPSKLKPGSKKAKRRLSFCRRMKGMKAKLTSAKTARDPDSRINKSLRKWNCE